MYEELEALDIATVVNPKGGRGSMKREKDGMYFGGSPQKAPERKTTAELFRTSRMNA